MGHQWNSIKINEKQILCIPALQNNPINKAQKYKKVPNNLVIHLIIDVFTTFTWSLGGSTVYVTGSFTKWKNHIPLQKNGHEYTITIPLQRNKHQYENVTSYKFIVDGEWRFNPDDPTQPDQQGNINNMIDTTNFKAIGTGFYQQKTIKKKNQIANNLISFADDAPQIPSHLLNIMFLNVSQFLQQQEGIHQNTLRSKLKSRHFKSPLHVQLNHLFTNLKNSNCYSITQRFKSKFTTYTFYMPSTQQ